MPVGTLRSRALLRVAVHHREEMPPRLAPGLEAGSEPDLMDRYASPRTRLRARGGQAEPRAGDPSRHLTREPLIRDRVSGGWSGSPVRWYLRPIVLGRCSSRLSITEQPPTEQPAERPGSGICVSANADARSCSVPHSGGAYQTKTFALWTTYRKVYDLFLCEQWRPERVPHCTQGVPNNCSGFQQFLPSLISCVGVLHRFLARRRQSGASTGRSQGRRRSSR
jgi:hypothetical protein